MGRLLELLQQGHTAVQQERIGAQQERIGVQQERIGAQQERTGVQLELLEHMTLLRWDRKLAQNHPHCHVRDRGDRDRDDRDGAHHQVIVSAGHIRLQPWCCPESGTPS